MIIGVVFCINCKPSAQHRLFAGVLFPCGEYGSGLSSSL